MSWYHFKFRPYVSKAKKQQLAANALAKLKKKNPNLTPVVIEGMGRTLANTWWGKAWNDNLTKYADYENRVGRGRSYVRNGAVLDLQIKEGEIRSMVQGSGSTPYKVVIKINELKSSIWEEIKKNCSKKLSHLSELLLGKFPKEVGTVFTSVGTGLFPEPKSMNFSCSCPDWADMCKHVAATLYGVGARLDKDPSLLFTLRTVDMKELIKDTLTGVKDELNRRAEDSKNIKDSKEIGGKRSRIIRGDDAQKLFQIDMAKNDNDDVINSNVISSKFSPLMRERIRSKRSKGIEKEKGKGKGKKINRPAKLAVVAIKKSKTKPKAKSKAKKGLRSTKRSV
ncbi:MAG: hypothetical protein HQK53_00280 [Oligoflexia bacterium]|nr:hypothetical protein [Oligoflexia bacterium]